MHETYKEKDWSKSGNESTIFSCSILILCFTKLFHKLVDIIYFEKERYFLNLEYLLTTHNYYQLLTSLEDNMPHNDT